MIFNLGIVDYYFKMDGVLGYVEIVNEKLNKFFYFVLVMVLNGVGIVQQDYDVSGDIVIQCWNIK